MRNDIIKILSAPAEMEPVYLLETKFNNIRTNNEKQAFIASLKYIFQNGSDLEKERIFLLLDIIINDNENRLIIEKEFKQVIMSSMMDYVSNKEMDNYVLNSLISLFPKFNGEYDCEFISVVLNAYKKYGLTNITYQLAINSLIQTTCWERLINHLVFAFSTKDESYLVDLSAYFLWKRGRNNFNLLVSKLDNKVKLHLEKLSEKIEYRLLTYKTW